MPITYQLRRAPGWRGKKGLVHAVRQYNGNRPVSMCGADVRKWPRYGSRKLGAEHVTCRVCLTVLGLEAAS